VSTVQFGNGDFSPTTFYQTVGEESWWSGTGKIIGKTRLDARDTLRVSVEDTKVVELVRRVRTMVDDLWNPDLGVAYVEVHELYRLRTLAPGETRIIVRFGEAADTVQVKATIFGQKGD
jgi:uncharacterized UPF0146 family protein